MLIIEKAKPLKIDFKTKIGFLIEKHRFNKSLNKKRYKDNFKETLIIDELLEAESE